MNLIFSLLLSAAIGGAILHNAEKPHINLGMDYVRARQILLGQGYIPATQRPTVPCEEGDRRCQNYPEMLYCSPTGIALCAFIWRTPRGETIEILTAGEDNPGVEQVRCILGCYEHQRTAP